MYWGVLMVKYSSEFLRAVSVYCTGMCVCVCVCVCCLYVLGVFVCFSFVFVLKINLLYNLIN